MPSLIPAQKQDTQHQNTSAESSAFHFQKNNQSNQFKSHGEERRNTNKNMKKAPVKIYNDT